MVTNIGAGPYVFDWSLVVSTPLSVNEYLSAWQLPDGKFELLPVEKDRFMCVSEDIGNFWLEIMPDSKGDIEGVKLIIGFSYLPFKRIRGLFFGI